MREPDVSAYHGILANDDPSQDGGVGVDGYAVFQDRVAREVRRVPVRIPANVLCAQRNSLI